MNIFLIIIAVVVVFGVLVLVHEFGHFITAKLTGMRVDEFAIGFGPQLVGFKYGETLYSLRLIPLGGFNKIAGMEEGEDVDAGERAYWRKPVWQRMIVIVAGGVMNILLAYFLLVGVYLYAGMNVPLKGPVLGNIMQNGPAARAGLQSGDIILAIDGQPVKSWQQFANTINSAGQKTLVLEYRRNNEDNTVKITPRHDDLSGRNVIGVVEATKHVAIPPQDAVFYAGRHLVYIVKVMVHSIGGMISGKVKADLAGPVGVVSIIGEAAQMGIQPLINITILLSINLGLLNLLPIPALDGGHFFTLVIEAVRGKPLSPEVMRKTQYVGFSLLILLMIFATVQDFSRILGK